MYDVSVRNASFSDMDSLCELFCYLFQQQHLGEPQLFRLPILDDEVERARLVRYIRSILEQPEHVLLVAMRADECIGFAHVVLRSSHLERAPRFVAKGWLRPPLQRKHDRTDSRKGSA